MNLKQYTALWALIVIIAAGFGITGNFSHLTALIFGFIGIGMIFVGMTSVRSSVMTHSQKKKMGKVPTIQPGRVPQTLFHRMRIGLQDWFVPEQVEVIRHRFR
jgi:Na+/phosphate symporter